MHGYGQLHMLTVYFSIHRRLRGNCPLATTAGRPTSPEFECSRHTAGTPEHKHTSCRWARARIHTVLGWPVFAADGHSFSNINWWGLPPLSHWLVEKIKAGEHVDFSELPLAKRKSHTSSQNWDVRTLLLQVQQTENPRCLILDFPAWAQRFALFATVTASHQPSMVADLMAYTVEMTKHPKRFQWSSWVIYDQNFCQEMITRPGLVWLRADSVIFLHTFWEWQSSRLRLDVDIVI